MTEITIETREDWNEGELDKTSADRDEESGNLGIGYLNGSEFNKVLSFIEQQPSYQYRFDKESDLSGTVTDYSGNNNDADVQGSPTSINGVFSTGAYGFEKDGVIVAPSNGDNIAADNMTVSMWLKPDDLSEVDDQRFISQDETGSSGPWQARFRDDGLLEFRIAPNSGMRNYQISNLNEGEWHHIVLTFDGDTQKIYIDAEEVDSESGLSNPSDSSSVDIGIGGTPNDDQRFDGGIDNVIIWKDYTASQDDVEELYFQGQENNNFEGEYTSKTFEPENGENIEVKELEITADIDADASADVTVEALDESDDIVDSDTITVSDGTDTYSVDLVEAPKFRIISEHEVSL